MNPCHYVLYYRLLRYNTRLYIGLLGWRWSDNDAVAIDSIQVLMERYGIGEVDDG
jgi:hypothetical protein